MEKDIGKINKGEYQGTVTDIVIGVREYNGRVGVDIREFVASEKYTGPTKKGLRIPAESFGEFKQMINSINEEDLKAEEKPEEPKEAPAEEPPKDQKTLNGSEEKKEDSEEAEEPEKKDLPDY